MVLYNVGTKMLLYCRQSAFIVLLSFVGSFLWLYFISIFLLFRLTIFSREVNVALLLLITISPFLHSVTILF
jgi:hypothetical protein